MGLGGTRITNEMKIGDYCVRVIANTNGIASFSVDTLEDAEYEANRIARARIFAGLPVSGATARRIIRRARNGYVMDKAIKLSIEKEGKTQ